MSEIKPRRKRRLREVPPVEVGEEKDWLGAEAHVPYHERPVDWLGPLTTRGAGFSGVAISLAFLGGALLGSLLYAVVERPNKSTSA